MACSLEFVEHLCDQLGEAGSITYKKMFGEYGLYCNGIFFGTAENDAFYVKITEAGQALLKNPVIEEPHQGVKLFLLEELDDRAFLAELVTKTCSQLKPVKMDYKKEFKDLYAPKAKPSMIHVPEMRFFTVCGKGDPNTSAEYAQALEILYGLSFTIKMSKKVGEEPEGYFEYVVPPLEGLWSIEGGKFDGMNITDKEQFCWTSMIRQPEFVTEDVFEYAKEKLGKKKPDLDLSLAGFKVWEEGMCIQIMHKGSYDEEARSIEKLNQFAETNSLVQDFSEERQHHEIYLSDPRRTAPEKLKTVIRHPVKKME